MSEPYLGEVKMFGGNFAPRGWAFCNGQLLSINQNAALFSLLGTFYGGNGTTTFALPNLQCCVPMHQGQGPGLGSYVLGQNVGSPSTQLFLNNIPSHTHTLNAGTSAGNSRTPSAATLLGDPGRNHDVYAAAGGSDTAILGPATIGEAGGGNPLSNLQPFLALSFIIALQGIFPSRN